MPQDAPLNSSAPGPVPEGPWSRVAGMQAKLHRWAAADPGRRFDDLFNLVHDPATLLVAFDRVAAGRDTRTPGHGRHDRKTNRERKIRAHVRQLQALGLNVELTQATA